MRNLNLSNYDVTVWRPDEKTGVPTQTQEPYEFKRSVIGVLFLQDNLTADKLLSRDDLARKIRDAEGSVLLEESEYQELAQAFSAFRGYHENDVPMVRRVLKETPEVAVQAVH